MKAAELRIGNYFINSIGDISSVQFGSWLETRYVLNGTPIPITEEWLLKFGFRPVPNWGFDKYIQDDCAIALYGNEYYIIPYEGPTTAYWIKVKIEYVHQLQNLYFALTGEELILAN